MKKDDLILLLADILKDFYKKYRNVGRTGYSGFRLFWQYIMDESKKIKDRK